MSRPARQPWRGSLRARLVMLSVAVLAPALLSMGLLLWSAYDHERHALERQLQERARSFGLIVDRQLGQDRVMAQALSADRSLREGDWRTFDRVARDATESSATWVVVTDPNGRQLVNTRVPPGEALPQTSTTEVGLTWAGTQQKGSAISNLFVGPAVRAPVIVVARPLVLNDGRRIQINVVTLASDFNDIWRGRQLPRNWTATILDQRAVIVARSRDAEKFVGHQASVQMRKELDAQPRGVANTRTLDGIDSVTAWSQAPGYQWTAVLAAPLEEIVGAARGSLMAAALTGLLLLGLSVLLALLMARRIVLPVERLTAAARDWEQSAAPRSSISTASGIAEIDDLGAALAHAADQLSAKQAELEDLNASLEERVAQRSRALEEATESLVQAQKLEAVGRLTGGVAHDFNNLLMAVSGNLDLLKRRLTDEKLLRYVTQARSAADRGAKLTGQLLAFSRKQRLQPRPVDVNGIVLEAGTMLDSTLGGAVRVDTVLDPVLWRAMADSTQLELVILNLVINARDAMPNGGVVTIETSNVVRDNQSDRPEAPPQGEFVMVAVADNGAGMTPDVAARVFEPFFTTKEVGQGSGLGLPQVLGLTKQLGGGVEIVTAPGRGTTVNVFLPRTESPDSGMDNLNVDTSAPDLTGLQMLVADDDADVRTVAVAILRDLGCVVIEVGSGLGAIGVAESSLPLDAVLLDFAMPGMNGLEAAERIAAARPEVPILMMSGYADAHALAGRWSGPLLHKPFTTSHLAIHVAEVVKREGGTRKPVAT